MIIYENTIQGFIEHCQLKNNDLLVTEIKANMKNKLGRGVSPSEERSWRTTLTKLGELFKEVESKDEQYILLEFKVPTTQKRIDVILAGSDGKKNSLLIIELKGWSKSDHSLIQGALKIDAIYGAAVSHPSEEAKEYKYLLTNQFSDIEDEFKNIEAISLLPNYDLLENDPLLSNQFKALIDYCKVYTKNNTDEFKKLIDALFRFSIPREKVEFLNKLEYKPTLDFKKHLEQQFQNIKLSSSQNLAFNTIKSQIDLHITNPKNKKLITISGMPGSGKTVVAFKVLGYIYTNKLLTAKLQLPGPEFRDSVVKTYGSNDFVNMIGGAYSKSDHSVVIIDEAHKAYGQGTAKQFYGEIFKNQNFVITLIDDKQVVNKKGFTKSQVIERAQEQQFDVIEIDLKEQFRNGGDALYIDWLNNWIHNENNYQDNYVENSYDFKVLDDIEFNTKYKEMYDKYNVRMSSFWTQDWNAEFDENDKPKKLIKVGSSRYVWNPNDYWVKSFQEYNPNSKVPKWFKKEVLDVNFNKDKKGSEYIAYFNTIQGSEFEYIFVHVPKLFYLNSNNELDVDLNQLEFNDMKYQVWITKGVPSKEKEHLNKMYFKNRLLVNLTRGTKGAFIYCEDKKLAKWLNAKIIKR